MVAVVVVCVRRGACLVSFREQGGDALVEVLDRLLHVSSALDLAPGAAYQHERKAPQHVSRDPREKRGFQRFA